MTTDERLAHLDRQEGRMLVLLERSEGRLGNLESLSEQLVEIQGRQQHQLEELKRDGQKTQRLWVRLCKKHGWLEDEDLLG